MRGQGHAIGTGGRGGKWLCSTICSNIRLFSWTPELMKCGGKSHSKQMLSDRLADILELSTL